MAPVLDVCIRGAGIVGRTLALLLARERLRVGLVQAAASSAAHSDVRAYALNAASRQLLESVRAWPDAAHATPVTGMEVHGDEGGQVRFRAGAPDPALAWIVDVPALEHRLDEALRYQSLATVLDAPAKAQLTVICEGRSSATRSEFGVQYDVQPYGQHAVAARLHCEKPHGHVAHQWFQGGEVLALLPMGGESPEGAHSLALVWSVGQDRADSLRHYPAAEFEADLTAASHETLGRLTLTSERAAWPLQLARADRWCGPGWALAGDAAHSIHPLAGQGLNLGLADARALAQVLHEREYWRPIADIRLLRRYERSRKADVLAMETATDGLQRLFAQDHAAFAALRNAGMRGFDASGPIKQWAIRQAAGL